MKLICYIFHISFQAKLLVNCIKTSSYPTRMFLDVNKHDDCIVSFKNKIVCYEFKSY